MTLRTTTLLAHLVASVHGHAALISPAPRNAVDRNLEPWAGGRFGDATCEHPIHGVDVNPLWGNGSCWGCNCVNGTEPCEVAQTCTYFSQGCAIGCATCDGQESNPNFKDRCGSGKKPTNNDPRFRSVNRAAEAMSDGDVYQHNPWRAPGNAPVFDPHGRWQPELGVDRPLVCGHAVRQTGRPGQLDAAAATDGRHVARGRRGGGQVDQPRQPRRRLLVYAAPSPLWTLAPCDS